MTRRDKLCFRIIWKVNPIQSWLLQYLHFKTFTDSNSCSSWPNNASAGIQHGCSTPPGGAWESLDNTMNTSDTLKCEILCLQKQEIGCCWLGDGSGCYWYAGGLAGVTKGAGSTSMSVTCNAGIARSILWLSYFIANRVNKEYLL